MRQFALSVSEPWDFKGPDGPNRVLVELVGVVGGPKNQDRDSRFLLLRATSPFEIDGEQVKLVVASPRYSGDTLDSVSSVGGTVGVARVLPHATVIPGGFIETTDVQCCIIGSLLPLANEPPSYSRMSGREHR